MKMESEDFVPTASAECGLFGVMEDHAESVQSLDEHFVKNPKSTFFLRASGESMLPLIHAQDVLIVDRSVKPVNNQIVVAVYEGELICKRLILRPSGIELLSENSKFSSIYFEDEQELVVWGVVTGIVRSLRL